MIDPYRDCGGGPHLYVDHLHPEHSQIWQIGKQLTDLGTFVRQLGYAVLLIDRCMEEKELAIKKRDEVPFNDETVGSRRFGDATWAMVEACAKQDEWIAMSARSGAIAVHDFFVTLTALGTNVKKATLLSGVVDTREIDRLVRDYSAQFPSRINMRNAIAHEVDVTKKPHEHATQRRPMTIRSAGGGIGSYSIGPNQEVVAKVDGPSLVRTWEGQIIEQGVTAATYMALLDFLRQAYALFDGVSKKLAQGVPPRS